MIANKTKRAGMILGVALSIGITGATQAQQFRGGGGPGGGFDRFGQPGVTEVQFERFGELLALDEVQMAAAEALFEGYQAEAQAASDEMRAMFEDARERMRETRDPSVFQDVMREARESRTRVEEAFLADLKSLLSEEQAANWDRVEQTRRRESTMRRGLLSGESADVVRIVSAMELDESTMTEVDAVLVRYEADLDRTLIERNKVYDEAQEVMREAFRSGDMDAAEEIFDKGRTASTRVRDVNRRYARQIQAMLGAEDASAFEVAFREASFPRIYGNSFGRRVMDAVESIESLDDTQRSSIDAIRQSYERDVKGINQDLETAIEREEAEAGPESFFRRGRGGPSETRDLYERRREIETAMVEKIRDVLTEEQAEALPEQRGNRGTRGGRGGGDAGDRSGRGGGQGDRPQRGGGGQRGGGDGGGRTQS